MSITQTRKAELIKQYGKGKDDTGGTEVQIAVLTERINNLTTHFKTNAKDFTSRRGLLILVGRRRNLLDYLKRSDADRYESLIKKLGLRK